MKKWTVFIETKLNQRLKSDPKFVWAYREVLQKILAFPGRVMLSGWQLNHPPLPSAIHAKTDAHPVFYRGAGKGTEFS